MSNMFYTLGASLAQAIGEDEILCRAVLRRTVMQNVRHLRQMTDPLKASAETMTYMAKMTYQDWKALIASPLLAENLMSLGVKDPFAISARLQKTLVEQQSLLTMAAH